MTLRQRVAGRPFLVVALFLALAGLVGVVSASVPAFAAPAGADLLPVPAEGRVVDAAGILGAESVQELNRISADLEAKNGVEVAVAVVQSTAPRTPDEYATALFQKWGVGKKGQDNGLLVLLALKERRVKVEVGYGLEGIFPDGRVGRLLDDFAMPSLKQGKYGQGLVSLVGEMARIAGAEYGVEGGATAPQPSSTPVRRGSAGAVGGVSSITAFIFLAMAMMVINAVRRPVRHRCPKCKGTLTEEQEKVRSATEQEDGLMRVHFHCPRCGYDRLAEVILPALVAGALVEEERRRFRGPFGPFGGGWGGGGGGGFGGGGGGFGGFGGGSSGGGGAGRGF